MFASWSETAAMHAKTEKKAESRFPLGRAPGAKTARKPLFVFELHPGEGVVHLDGSDYKHLHIGTSHWPKDKPISVGEWNNAGIFTVSEGHSVRIVSGDLNDIYVKENATLRVNKEVLIRGKVLVWPGAHFLVCTGGGIDLPDDKWVVQKKFDFNSPNPAPT
jgi:hypothetical protein